SGIGHNGHGNTSISMITPTCQALSKVTMTGGQRSGGDCCSQVTAACPPNYGAAAEKRWHVGISHMDYEWCRLNELARHAAEGDAKAQAILIEEIRSYLRDLVERYGAADQTTAEFAQQMLSRARRDCADFCVKDSQFGSCIDGIVQREVGNAC